MRKEYVFLVYRWVKSFQNSGSIFSQKIQKLKEYNKYIINDCYLTRTYNEFSSLDNLVNSVLVFNTKENGKHVNIEYNY